MSEEFEREQKIVDAVDNMQFVEDLKVIATGRQTVMAHRPEAKDFRTAGEYILYLENQVACFDGGDKNPAGGNFKTMADQDIQIIYKQPDANNMFVDAKIMTLNGRVKVQGGVKGYVQAVLEDAPEDMKFTLIEETPRKAKEIISAIVKSGRVKILYEDGSFQHVAISIPAKETFEFKEPSAQEIAENSSPEEGWE